MNAQHLKEKLERLIPERENSENEGERYKILSFAITYAHYQNTLNLRSISTKEKYLEFNDYKEELLKYLTALETAKTIKELPTIEEGTKIALLALIANDQTKQKGKESEKSNEFTSFGKIKAIVLSIEQIINILERGKVSDFLKYIKIFLKISPKELNGITYPTISTYEQGSLPSNLNSAKSQNFYKYLDVLFAKLEEKQGKETAKSIKTKFQHVFAINQFLKDGDLGNFLTTMITLGVYKKKDISSIYINYEKKDVIPSDDKIEKVLSYLHISEDLKNSFKQKINKIRDEKEKEKAKKTAVGIQINAQEKNSQPLKTKGYYISIFENMPENTTFRLMIDLFKCDFSADEIKNIFEISAVEIKKRARAGISHLELARRVGIEFSTYDQIDRTKVGLDKKVKIVEFFMQDEEGIVDKEKTHEIITHFVKQERDKNFKKNYQSFLDSSEIKELLNKILKSANVSYPEMEYLLGIKGKTIENRINNVKTLELLIPILELLVPQDYLKTVITKISQIQNKLKAEAIPTGSVRLQERIIAKQ